MVTVAYSQAERQPVLLRRQVIGWRGVVGGAISGKGDTAEVSATVGRDGAEAVDLLGALRRGR